MELPQILMVATLIELSALIYRSTDITERCGRKLTKNLVICVELCLSFAVSGLSTVFTSLYKVLRHTRGLIYGSDSNMDDHAPREISDRQ